LYFAERVWNWRCWKWGWADVWTRPTSSIRCSRLLPIFLWTYGVAGPTVAAITRERRGFCGVAGRYYIAQLAEANQVLGEMAMELGVRAVNAAAYMPAMHADRVGPYGVEVFDAAVEVASL